MTGDTTPTSDEAVMADIRLCLASYGFIAANQAEFLLAEVARLSAAPLLVSAEAERLRESAEGLLRFTHDVADAVGVNLLDGEGAADYFQRIVAEVEGLRAELAERDAKLREAMRVSEWRVSAKDDGVFAIAVATLTQHWDCGDGL